MNFRDFVVGSIATTIDNDLGHSRSIGRERERRKREGEREREREREGEREKRPVPIMTDRGNKHDGIWVKNKTVA